MKHRTFWLLLVALAALTGCNAPDMTDLSDDVIGTWTTTESRYADRFITLQRTRLSFGTGGSDFTLHPVSSIEGRTEPEEGRVLYTVYYPVEGEEQQFSFYYYPAKESIQLKNQTFDWTRSEPEQ